MAIVLLLATLVLYARVMLEPVLGPMPVDPASPDGHKPASWAFLVAPLMLSVVVLVMAMLGALIATIRAVRSGRSSRAG